MCKSWIDSYDKKQVSIPWDLAFIFRTLNQILTLRYNNIEDIELSAHCTYYLILLFLFSMESTIY